MSQPTYPDLFVATFPLVDPVPPAQLRREAAGKIARMSAANGATFAPTSDWDIKVSSTTPKRVTVIARARSTHPRTDLLPAARAFIREVEGIAPALAERCRAHMAEGAGGGGVGRRESRPLASRRRGPAFDVRSVLVLTGGAGLRAAW